MPRPNRKKKGSQGISTPGQRPQNSLHAPTKRILVDDADGWTHVIDAPSSRRCSPAAASSSRHAAMRHAGDWERDGVAFVNMSLAEMKQEFAYWNRAWRSSDSYRDLQSIFTHGADEVNPPKATVDINNVVCLGLGSLQRASREGRRNSFVQLAALLSMVEWLGALSRRTWVEADVDVNVDADADAGRVESRKAITCLFQDPQFTQTDGEFLSSLEHEVQEDPEAFKSVNGHTMVYAIHCYANIYQTLSAGPPPGLLIGTDLDKFGTRHMWDDNAIFPEPHGTGGRLRAGSEQGEQGEQTSTALVDLVHGCESFDFPQHGLSFTDTKLYWRRRDSGVAATHPGCMRGE